MREMDVTDHFYGGGGWGIENDVADNNPNAKFCCQKVKKKNHINKQYRKLHLQLILKFCHNSVVLKF